jgi:phenylalanyl-tRNA synthetase alpha chain
MLEELEKIRLKAFTELGSAANLKELEQWRIRYLGKKSRLTQILRSISTLSLEERRNTGANANAMRKSLEEALEEKSRTLKTLHLAPSLEKRVDITLPGYPIPIGRSHPTTQTIEEICQVFQNMGFQIFEGPDVEWDYYNFEALNIPADHPARDMFATFWIDSNRGEKNRLLRTHTSPMQIRVMEQLKPPIRMIVPGRCYRYEATDTTHESMFYQVEGLAVDKNITMADLKGTLFDFCRCIFGDERKVRFRCDYFPFVEPGVEIAIECLACHGNGCRTCGYTGWIEILGAGMVNPNVLRGVGLDPDVYSGFAFGMGVERIPMLRYGIDDIRLFYNNDIRFLRQF